MTVGVVAVTGASGFIGGHVCRALAARGVAVRALTRGGRQVPGLQSFALDDPASLLAGLRGADAVVHLAARVHVMNDPAHGALGAYRTSNAELTRHLLAQAGRAGVRRIVFASSVKAMGESTDHPWTEETPAAPVDPYGISKLEAEALVLDDPAVGSESIVLRLPMTYGPGVKGNMIRLIRWIDAGRPIIVGATPNERSLAYVGNVAASIVTVLDHPGAGGERFLVSDGPPVSTEALVHELARHLGRPGRVIQLPAAVEAASAWVADRLRRVPAIAGVRARLDRLTSSLALDVSKLTRVTGFVPPYTFEEGIAHTVDWYRRAEQA